MATARFQLEMPLPGQLIACVETGDLPSSEIGLVVFATGRSHRASKVFLRCPLDGPVWDAYFLLERTSAELILGDLEGFSVTVAIVLLEDVPASPLQPYLAGTWLAKRDFVVRPEVDDTSFSPDELSDEIRRSLGLPEGVVRYIEVDGVLEEDSLADAVRVYVDPEMLGLLLSNPDSTAALNFQAELAMQTTEAVVSSIANELETQEPGVTNLEPEEHPAAHRFLQRISASTGLSVPRILELARTERLLLRAHLEAAFKIRGYLGSSLKEH